MNCALALCPRMTLRVLFVNPLGDLGGSERSLLDAMTSLRQAGEDVEVTLLSFQEGELAARARALGVSAEILPLPSALAELGESSAEGSGPGSFARAALRAARFAPAYGAEFRRRVQELGPSVLHTNGMKAHLLAGTCFRRLPLVAHLRDFPSERPFSRFALPLLRRPRALVVTNSRAVAEDVKRVSRGIRTRVVYNGIDVEEFRPGARELEPLALLAGLPVPSPDTLVVGLVATYAWWKGHELFLDAAARVRALARRPLRFYVVGGPIYGTSRSELGVADLERMIAARGLENEVGLVPFQHEVAGVYRGLDVVVHASTRPEPFGRTIVEAMATGRAVAVARAGGAAEVFDEGRSGLGYEPGNIEDLSRVLLELVTNAGLRARLGEGARAEALARFDRARVGVELLA
ncbi:MAG TPA: glycosyltransferase family 4 protein, partial [Polyangiaceae bacterium]